jgi:hypothetical protein
MLSRAQTLFPSAPTLDFPPPNPLWGAVVQQADVRSLSFRQGQSEGKLSCSGSFGSNRLFWNFQIALFLVFIDFLVLTNYTQQSSSVDADSTYKFHVTSSFFVADVLHNSPARKCSQSLFFPERERPSFAWIRSRRNYGLYVLMLTFLRGWLEDKNILSCIFQNLVLISSWTQFSFIIVFSNHFNFAAFSKNLLDILI